MPLHLSKVALGAATVEEVLGWFQDRDSVMRHVTRFRPKREAELAGGSLYWIVKHRLVLRTPIIGFEDSQSVVVGSSSVRPLLTRSYISL